MSRNKSASLLLLTIFAASCGISPPPAQLDPEGDLEKALKPVTVSAGATLPEEVALAIKTPAPDYLPEEPLSMYGNPSSYVALGVRYHVLDSAEGYVEDGLASWYGPKFHGQETSNKEIFDMYQLSAAHKTLPLPTWVEVTHLETGKSVKLRVNDRGPFKRGRIIDLSYQAAHALGIKDAGVAPVQVRALQGPSKTAKGRHRIYLQLAAFRKQGNAINFHKKLASRGAKNLSVHHGARGDRLYRVLHGPLHNSREIKRAEMRLRALGITEVTPISLPAKKP